MSREYYQYQDAKVRIAHRLFQLSGWTVYGYHANNSDLMTDYYDPAYWNGIAEKNGYKLVVDQSSAAEERRYTVATSEKVSGDAKTREKIAKLQEMTQERGATEAEETAAKKAISALLQKEQKEDEEKTGYKEIIEPGHMANPPRCNWHIEKDGVIIDKGTGLLKFSNVPDITDERELKDWQDFNNLSAEEWIENLVKYMEIHSYYYNVHTDDERREYAVELRERAVKKYALLEKFNVLINRWDTTCGGMVGNTDDFYTYKEITVTEYRKEIKAQETESGELKEGQHFVIKSSGFSYGVCRGYVYVIHEKEGTHGNKYYTAVRMNAKHTKELTGTANPANFFGYFTNEKDTNRLLKWIEKGTVAWCDLVDVSTPYEVKKVVKEKVSSGPSAKPEKEEKKTAEPTEEEAAHTETAANEDAREPETVETEQEAAENAAPDMFATLATAYIQKKNGESRAESKSTGAGKAGAGSGQRAGARTHARARAGAGRTAKARIPREQKQPLHG